MFGGKSSAEGETGRMRDSTETGRKRGNER